MGVCEVRKLTGVILPAEPSAGRLDDGSVLSIDAAGRVVSSPDPLSCRPSDTVGTSD